jgi:hypothetical protein
MTSPARERLRDIKQIIEGRQVEGSKIRLCGIRKHRAPLSRLFQGRQYVKVQ